MFIADLRFVFDSSDECTIVHSALYSCLRAVFGLSVAGVLVAVFSCMLVYQLLSHERKKMYWEQLELRCRSLYAGPQGPPPPPPLANGPSIIGTPRSGPCRCCEQCHSHRAIMQPAYPWDGGDGRFWGPAPGTGGNFYSPNPGGEEHLLSTRSLGQIPLRPPRPGWSWPRLPWQRNDAQRFRQTPSSPDSQYGFSNGVPTRMDNPNLSNIIQTQAGFTLISGSQHYGVWGPPPPYSDPNSPARRGRLQYNYASQCHQIMEHQVMPQTAQPQHQPGMNSLECHQHTAATENHAMEPFCHQPVQQLNHRANSKKQAMMHKQKETAETSTPSDSDTQRENMSNTLPFRKAKKRMDAGVKSIGPNQSTARVNVQNVFNPVQNASVHHELDYSTELGADEAGCSGNATASTGNNAGAMSHPPSFKHKGTKSKAGVENTGFQAIDENKASFEPPESEVYFADVSSCCNTSVKNDTFFDEVNQKPQKRKKEDNEDYLVQRFGKREASIRSRLPFPQALGQDFDKTTLLSLQQAMGASTRNSMIQKDISRQSMCSMDSGEKTDFTDLSPATPCASYGPSYPMQETNEPNISYQRDRSSGHFTSARTYNDFNEPTSSTNFVALFPYSSNEQSQEAHRRPTKNLPELRMTTDLQAQSFENREACSNASFNLNNSNASSTSYHDQDSMNSYVDQFLNGGTNSNLTPNKRSPIGGNINTLIQNISDHEMAMLYGEKSSGSSGSRRESDGETQDCNTTIGSGQSDHSHASGSRL